MSAVAPHQMIGNARTFTAANTPPTPIHLSSTIASNLQVVVTNAGSVPAVIGIGKDAATATANAAAVVDNATYSRTILATTQVTWTVPADCWMTGFTASSTAVITVETGEGI